MAGNDNIIPFDRNTPARPPVHIARPVFMRVIAKRFMIEPKHYDPMHDAVATAHAASRIETLASDHNVPLDTQSKARIVHAVLIAMPTGELENLNNADHKYSQILDHIASRALYDHALDRFVDLATKGSPEQPMPDFRPRMRTLLEQLLPSSRDPMSAIWPPLSRAALDALSDTISGPIHTTWNHGVTSLSAVSYYKGLKLHRLGSEGPAHVVSLPWGDARIEYWQDGLPHRNPSEGPARIHMMAGHDHPITVEYHVHGKLHRDDGPAEIRYSLYTDAHGKTAAAVSTETYFLNGLCHRDGAPAEIGYDTETGRVTHELWIVNGLRHRVGGPSFTMWDSCGTVTMQQTFHHEDMISTYERVDGELKCTFDRYSQAAVGENNGG